LIFDFFHKDNVLEISKQKNPHNYYNESSSPGNFQFSFFRSYFFVTFAKKMNSNGKQEIKIVHRDSDV